MKSIVGEEGNNELKDSSVSNKLSLLSCKQTQNRMKNERTDFKRKQWEIKFKKNLKMSLDVTE